MGLLCRLGSISIILPVLHNDPIVYRTIVSMNRLQCSNIIRGSSPCTINGM